MNRFKTVWNNWPAYSIYIAVTLAVLLPLLKPGFVLTLDMVFTPTLRMPGTLTSSYLFQALLHILNIGIPADVIQKMLLVAIMLVSSIGMHTLLTLLWPKKSSGEWGIYIGSIFYIINPFTYSRLMAGQYSVLMGYALLPWFVRLLVLYGREQTWQRAGQLGVLAGVIGTVSIHTLGDVAVLMAAAGGVWLWQKRKHFRQLGRHLAVAGGTFLVLCGFWLLPLAIGHGATANTIQSFGAADSQAFATLGGNPLARLGNVLRLQGFWAEGHQLYLLPQERIVFWGVLMLLVIGLVIAGGVALWRLHQPAAILVITAGIVSIALAIGLGSPLLTGLGFREPHKFVALVALLYSLLLAFGVNAALQRVQQRHETMYMYAALGLLFVPLLVTRVMFWGGNGQLSSQQYPAGWQAVNRTLNSDHDRFLAVFLPWHQYMSFNFTGRIIANPAPRYFDRPVIASQNPELGGAVSGAQNAVHTNLEQILPQAKRSENFGRQLAQNNIKYVLLAKELDYRQYDYIRKNTQLRLIRDYPDIALYQNTAWRSK